MKTQWQEFYEKAVVLGHDTDALARGAEEVRYFRFETVYDSAKLLSVATPEQRILRQETFYQPALIIRERLGQGKHDRGEAVTFANGELCEADAQGLQNHLPGRIKAVSVLEKTIPAGEVWDISVRGSEWDIDDMEELYTTINVGRLILEPGAKVVVRGNVASILCQELIVLKDHSIPDTETIFHNYQIGILPTPFSVDFKSGPLNGADGENGEHGDPGSDGIPPHYSSTLLGYQLLEETSQEQMSGNHGSSGTDGTPGVDGRNGGMCKIAEITIRNLEGNLTVFSQAGKGGDGGHGGSGGDGGHGGNGTTGCKLMRSILPSGYGGNAGHAAHGAKGGNAGHGGLSSNIYVNVPEAQTDQVNCIALFSEGGKGGKGGATGRPGRGGKNGGGSYPATDGTDGNAAESGKDGKDGRQRPAAAMFLNEQNTISDLSIFL